jgi:SAM-dependent methyltransferase
VNSSPKPAPGPGRRPAGGRPASEGQLILQRRLRLVRPWLPAGSGRLVDFGCGNGAQTLLLAPHFEQTTGLDVQEDFLAQMRQAVAERGWEDRVAVERIGGAGDPLAAGSADVVTSFTVLEHVPDERAALARMHELLRPGGRLLISVPNKWWVFETHGADLPLLPWNRVPLVSWWPRALHSRWARARIYTVGDITRLLREAGFEVDEVVRMTAPMDMISWRPLRDLVRGTVFRSDRTTIPFLATEILVAATR